MFEGLDFLYMPSRDVAADANHFTDALGGEPVFRIEAFGARVAMVRLAPDSPHLLFADHLDGERPVLVYRVANLDEALRELEGRGLELGASFEIPHGPCCSLDAPGGHRVAIYQLTRPDVAERFTGRHDF
jgi:hypothetical protein